MTPPPDSPVILVGLRLKDVPGYRVQNWAFNRRRWEETLGWPIYEGHYNAEPFSLARASNLAARRGPWRSALYVGADFLLSRPEQAYEAVETAEKTGQLCFAHDRLIQLEEDETAVLVAGDASVLDRARGKRHPNTFSGAFGITRELWDSVGGFDERFVDWGWDDLAFWAACCAIGGGFQRVRGLAYHLWHPRSHEENEGNPHHAANSVLGRRYLAAKSDHAATMDILTEPGAPLDLLS